MFNIFSPASQDRQAGSGKTSLQYLFDFTPSINRAWHLVRHGGGKWSTALIGHYDTAANSPFFRDENNHLYSQGPVFEEIRSFDEWLESAGAVATTRSSVDALRRMGCLLTIQSEGQDTLVTNAAEVELPPNSLETRWYHLRAPEYDVYLRMEPQNIISEGASIDGWVVTDIFFFPDDEIPENPGIGCVQFEGTVGATTRVQQSLSIDSAGLPQKDILPGADNPPYFARLVRACVSAVAPTAYNVTPSPGLLRAVSADDHYAALAAFAYYRPDLFFIATAVAGASRVLTMCSQGILSFGGSDFEIPAKSTAVYLQRYLAVFNDVDLVKISSALSQTDIDVVTEQLVEVARSLAADEERLLLQGEPPRGRVVPFANLLGETEEEWSAQSDRVCAAILATLLVAGFASSATEFSLSVKSMFHFLFNRKGSKVEDVRGKLTYLSVNDLRVVSMPFNSFDWTWGSTGYWHADSATRFFFLQNKGDTTGKHGIPSSPLNFMERHHGDTLTANYTPRAGDEDRVTANQFKGVENGEVFFSLPERRGFPGGHVTLPVFATDRSTERAVAWPSMDYTLVVSRGGTVRYVICTKLTPHRDDIGSQIHFISVDLQSDIPMAPGTDWVRLALKQGTRRYIAGFTVPRVIYDAEGIGEDGPYAICHDYGKDPDALGLDFPKNFQSDVTFARLGIGFDEKQYASPLPSMDERLLYLPERAEPDSFSESKSELERVLLADRVEYDALAAAVKKVLLAFYGG